MESIDNGAVSEFCLTIPGEKMFDPYLVCEIVLVFK